MSSLDLDFQIGGTLVWYYFICRREVWLISHQLTPDQEDQNILLGRLIDQTAYPRKKKQLIVGSSKMDIFRIEKNSLIIGEIKKSSKYLRSAKMQLAFYLKELQQLGVYAKGELRFPKEKKVINVELDEETSHGLEEAVEEIFALVALGNPPAPKRVHWCSKCAYREFCWV